jgi:hypothetical protein
MVVRLDVGDKSRRWLKLAIIIIALIPLFWATLTRAITDVYHLHDPQIALALHAGDPLALVTSAEQMLIDGPVSSSAASTIAGAARRSIEAQALNPYAAKLLAGVLLARGDVNGMALFRVADRMTRRDLGVQLWLVEDAVRRDDISAALAHYDSALRVTASVAPTLFAILSEAIDDPRLWPAFRATIPPSSPWLGAFLRYAAKASRHPASIVGLLAHYPSLPPRPEFDAFRHELIGQLIARNDFATARMFYLAQPGADPTMLNSVSIGETAADPRYTPFSWRLFNDNAVQSTFVSSSESGGLSIQVTLAEGSSGVIAQKMTLLPPGRYQLVTRQHIDPASTTARITWRARCSPNATAPTFWQSGPLTPADQSAFNASIIIPAACAAPTLEVLGDAGSGAGDLSVSLEQVGIKAIATHP